PQRRPGHHVPRAGAASALLVWETRQARPPAAGVGAGRRGPPSRGTLVPDATTPADLVARYEQGGLTPRRPGRRPRRHRRGRPPRNDRGPAGRPPRRPAGATACRGRPSSARARSSRATGTGRSASAPESAVFVL